MKHPSSLTQIFCKAPVLGQVKTRLRSALSEEECLLVYEEMLGDSISRLTDDPGLCHSQIWIAGDTNHVFFDKFDVPTRVQGNGDLGQRMRNALVDGLEDYQKVVLVGVDVPSIDGKYVDEALSRLDSHDVAIGPAEDGGYGLVGICNEVPDMFGSIDWGTDCVLEQTCAHLNRFRSNYCLLPTVWDVDSPEDLQRYRKMQTLHDPVLS